MEKIRKRDSTMVEIQPKNGATYAAAYRKLVGKMEAFAPTELNKAGEGGQVLVDQMIMTGATASLDPTRLILQGNLGSGPVLGQPKPVSLECIPMERYTRRPATKLEFEPSGNQLKVAESYFPNGDTFGTRRTFQVNLTDNAISEVKEERVERTVSPGMDPGLQNQLNQLGYDASAMTYVMADSRFCA